MRLKRYFSLRYGARLRTLKHLPRRLVFALDLTLAALSVFVSLGVMSLLSDVAIPSGRNTLVLLLTSVALSGLLFVLTGSHRASIRFSTLREAGKILWLLTAKAPAMFVLTLGAGIFGARQAIVYVVTEAMTAAFLMLFSRSAMISLYHALTSDGEARGDNVLIYGTGAGATQLATHINDERRLSYRIVGFLNPGGSRGPGIRIRGLNVWSWNGDPSSLDPVITSRGITHILFTSAADFSRERDSLVDHCISNNIRMLMSGEIQSLGPGKDLPRLIKPIDIEDLLYRDEITTDESNVARELTDRTVLVTGAAGSIGRGIILRLLQFDVRRLILVDSAETPLHDLELELARDHPGREMVFVLGDVRSRQRLGRVFDRHRPDYVFHAAAYKHVPVIEQNPCEGILTNIWGTINTARHAIRTGVVKFVMVSTDKAVNPTGVMGATKRIAELWVRSLRDNSSGTRFIITRFGNVLGSNGSVIPIFREQIAAGGPVTVTHPDMTRYFMTIPEACRLVLQATAMGSGGEIFVFDMGRQVRIDDLARRMILLSGFMPDDDIRVEYTGLRPGEKLYEELLSEAEATEATLDEKIRIVKARRIDTTTITSSIKALVSAAHRGDTLRSVRLMKILLPEFKSNNSRFEAIDLEHEPATISV